MIKNITHLKLKQKYKSVSSKKGHKHLKISYILWV